MTSNKSCKSESADVVCESANDLKCTAVCTAENQPQSDRRQRREKRPDIQRYVPKPKQLPQHDPDGSSASSTVSAKSSDHRAFVQLESVSDQKQANAESCKPPAAALPKSTGNLASDTNTSQHIPQSRRSQSGSAAEQCSSESTKSSATVLPHSFANLSLSAVKTTELEDSNKPMPGRMKQKVSKPVKPRSDEPKQEQPERFVSASALRKADGDIISRPGDSIRSDNLDWDFDGEFEYCYGRDGVSWGDLPPPSEHDSSDEEVRDDSGVRAESAANTRKQKSQKLHGNLRRKKQAQNRHTRTSEDIDYAVSEPKLTDNNRNSSAAVESGYSKSKKLEKMVVTASRFVEDREPSTHGDEILNTNHDVDDHCSAKVNIKSYSHLHRRKEITEKSHFAVNTESEQRGESKQQRPRNRNAQKQHSDANLKDSNIKKEENTQQRRPDSGRVGGIIHLPVGTVTTASHDVALSAPSQMSTSSRGRNRRSHGTSGCRALWSPDKLNSLSAPQRQGAPVYEQAQLHAAYPADYAQYYQQPTASPQLYYAEYPPVSGTSQMPAVDGYIYGYPPAVYDGLGYVDDSYYH